MLAFIKKSSFVFFVVYITIGCQSGENGPEPTNSDSGIIGNPGNGLHTFHRVNGFVSEEEYPISSVAYERWYWNEVEPERYQISFEAIDAILERAQQHNQTLAFRLMVNGMGAMRVPQWAIDLGLQGVHYQVEEGPSFMPDHSHPVFLEEMSRLLTALGERYDGDPRLEFVDIGVLGMTGEWHMGKSGMDMPTWETQKSIIDMHFDAFPNTQLVMLIGEVSDGGKPLSYALSRGAGWRADCLGDQLWRAPGWNHMDDFYPSRIHEEAVASGNWKTHPVVFETCGDPVDWLVAGISPEKIQSAFDWALKYHVSMVNFRSKPVPAELRPIVDDFLKKMGYQLKLQSVSLPVQANAGSAIVVESVWKNQGVAPPYKPFQLKYRLVSMEGKVILEHESDADLKKWLPGEHIVTEQIMLPKNALSPGIYTLDIGILWDTDQFSRPVLFVTDGDISDKSGWQTINKITIE